MTDFDFFQLLFEWHYEVSVLSFSFQLFLLRSLINIFNFRLLFYNFFCSCNKLMAVTWGCFKVLLSRLAPDLWQILIILFLQKSWSLCLKLCWCSILCGVQFKILCIINISSNIKGAKTFSMMSWREVHSSEGDGQLLLDDKSIIKKNKEYSKRNTPGDVGRYKSGMWYSLWTNSVMYWCFRQLFCGIPHTVNSG